MTGSPWKQRTVFLTGATGFVGSELMRRFLDAGVKKLFVLVRGNDDATREQKLDHAMGRVYGRTEDAQREKARKRLVLVPGDITRPALGIAEKGRKRLLAQVDHVVHCAANVSFGATLEEHLVQNLWGTRYALNLAEEIHADHGLTKFDLVGTAFIAGTRQGLIREDELDVGQGFCNSYEESKFQAELEAFRRQGDFPITRFRPSIVVGDQKTGRTSSFKMLYWLVKVYQQGLWRMVPARKDAVVDLVPVDVVADAILNISPCEWSHGKAVHIAAGPLHCCQAEELAELVRRFFNGPRVIFFSPEFYQTFIGPPSRLLARGKLRHVLTRGRVYEPYFINRKIFDTANFERGMAGTGLEVPDVTGYFSNLLQFCIDTEWGKKQLGAP